MKKITIAWAPNAKFDDIILAFNLLFQPWRWFGDSAVKNLENKISTYIGQDVVSFDSGRSSLYAILKTLGIGENDEVLLQSFTCVALPNPILWVSAKPVYVDVDKNNYNLDLDDLEKKITDKSKAVIVQYTFGIVPNMDRIIEICKKHNLLLIEDNCHNLGQKIKIKGELKNAGTIGDAAMFSLGQEKVISATRAGFATIKNLKNLTKLKNFQLTINKPRIRDVVRGILNPIIWKIREKWGGVGEFIYRLMVKFKLQELGLTKLELVGKKAPWLPYKLPNTNAILGLYQFNKIEHISRYRLKISRKYFEQFSLLSRNILNKLEIKIVDQEKVNTFGDAGFLRFPVIVKNAEDFRLKAEKSNIILGNWYTEVIHCQGVDLCQLKYSSDCPNAEWLVKHVINLPTHVGIGDNEIRRVMELFKDYDSEIKE